MSLYDQEFVFYLCAIAENSYDFNQQRKSYVYHGDNSDYNEDADIFGAAYADEKNDIMESTAPYLFLDITKLADREIPLIYYKELNGRFTLVLDELAHDFFLSKLTNDYIWSKRYEDIEVDEDGDPLEMRGFYENELPFYNILFCIENMRTFAKYAIGKGVISSCSSLFMLDTDNIEDIYNPDTNLILGYFLEEDNYNKIFHPDDISSALSEFTEILLENEYKYYAVFNK